ncbi:hypothetical protein R1flu_003389 [Riccia fluitans]|uniref:Uncharacterized protein n=1 Tax=Riccia fluitans TaxID=41844 RepID=A0ABD1Y9U5_9MARC
MLKDKHPAAWKALHAAHHIVRGWFKDWETDQRQHDILHLNFTKHPRMKDELNEFIRPKMAELPALVFAVGGLNGTATYSYSWKQEDIYQHILSHRYDLRKKMKKRLSEGESSGSETILASQSFFGNKYPGGQYSQLLGDEPELMNRILDGERLVLHLMKNKPTIDTLVAREKTEVSQTTSEVVKLAGIGTPVAYGQKEPYITFKLDEEEKHRKTIECPQGRGAFPFWVQFHVWHMTHEFLTNFAKNYGPLMTLKLGSKSVVVASSSKVAEEFLKANDRVWASRPPGLFPTSSATTALISSSPLTDPDGDMQEKFSWSIFSVPGEFPASRQLESKKS